MSAHVRVAVVGAMGYGGAETIRLLSGHPSATVTLATSARLAGQPLRDECSWLSTDLILSEFQPEALDVDVVVLAQENGFAMEHIARIPSGIRVIDLSADFRLRDAATYSEYYGRPAADPAVNAVYGLPELGHRDAVRGAMLVANPGCYPTASLLALAPLKTSGLITGVPVIDAKSGVSGAGRSRKETEYLFGELAGNFRAYGVVKHRHTPEIEQELGRTVRFTPHLLPTSRGIHVTAHVPTSASSVEQLRAIYVDYYHHEPFVRVVKLAPGTKQVQGSNRCDIFVDYDPRSGMAVVLSVIDNLVKGMAGQAIQNLNLMFEWEETLGLPQNGVWP